MMAAQLHIEDLLTVQPADVVSYLLRSGWHETGTFGRAAVWTRTAADDEFEVLVPNSSQLRDYPVRIAELIETVAQVEQRGEDEVLRDLQSSTLDVQHIRTQPEGPSGTIPIREGLKAIGGVHDLLLAAATSTPSDARATVLPSQKPSYAWDFLNGVRLGPTTRGSYILRVETPIEPAEDPEALASSRKVLLHMRNAVQDAYSAAWQSAREHSLDVFTGFVSSGVSANLCEALADIGGQQRSPFEIQFSWAPKVPVTDDGPASVDFDSNVIGQIKRAGKYLRELPIAESATIIGRVIELHQDSPQRLGRVLLQGKLTTGKTEETDQKVLVQLPARIYQLAVEAHRTSRRITVTGQMKKSGRNPEITVVSRIEYAE
jgi:hypothetical protein